MCVAYFRIWWTSSAMYRCPVNRCCMGPVILPNGTVQFNLVLLGSGILYRYWAAQLFRGFQVLTIDRRHREPSKANILRIPSPLKMLKQIPLVSCSDAVGRSRHDGVASSWYVAVSKGEVDLTWLKRSKRLHLLINHGLDEERCRRDEYRKVTWHCDRNTPHNSAGMWREGRVEGLDFFVESAIADPAWAVRSNRTWLSYRVGKCSLGYSWLMSETADSEIRLKLDVLLDPSLF